MSSVQELCSRAILIEKGELIMDDEPDAVIKYCNEHFVHRPKEKRNQGSKKLLLLLCVHTS